MPWYWCLKCSVIRMKSGLRVRCNGIHCSDGAFVQKTPSCLLCFRPGPGRKSFGRLTAPYFKRAAGRYSGSMHSRKSSEPLGDRSRGMVWSQPWIGVLFQLFKNASFPICSPATLPANSCDMSVRAALSEKARSNACRRERSWNIRYNPAQDRLPAARAQAHAKASPATVVDTVP